MSYIKTLRVDLNKTFVNIGFAGAFMLTFLLCFTAPAYVDYNTGKTYSIFEALFSMDSRFIEELFAHGLNFLAYGIDTILMVQHCRAITSELNQICASNLRRKEPEL